MVWNSQLSRSFFQQADAFNLISTFLNLSEYIINMTVYNLLEKLLGGFTKCLHISDNFGIVLSVTEFSFAHVAELCKKNLRVLIFPDHL